MNTRSLMLFAGTMLATSGLATAQRINAESGGDLAFLKGETKLKIEYVYDGQSVGKHKTEEEYTSTKVAEYNKEESGKGDKWLKSWKGARSERYQPKFEELFNKFLSEKGVTTGPSEKAKYTVIVKTTRTEPGFNAAVIKMPAMVDYDFVFVETVNHKNVLATLNVRKVQGSQVMGYDFDAGTRLAESYAKAGKMLAKYIVDKIE